MGVVDEFRGSWAKSANVTCASKQSPRSHPLIPQSVKEDNFRLSDPAMMPQIEMELLL